MKHIVATKTREKALVDDRDYEELRQYSWLVNNHGYFYRRVYAGSRKMKKIYLHREIMSCPKGMVVDHINGISTDCRRENLRICSHSNNQKNMSMHKDNLSGYKGVCWQRGKYVARVFCNGVAYYLGRHETAHEAAKAYDTKALELFGAFAKLNLEGEGL